MNRHPSPGLRSLDWRFLLPASAASEGASLWLSDIASHYALTAAEVGFEPIGGEDPKAAVVLRTPDERCGLEDSVRRLGTAGVLCWQVDRRVPQMRFVSPACAVAALRRLGLGEIRIYWTRGAHARPTTFVPIDRPAPLRWFLRNALERRTSRLSAGAVRIIVHLLAGFRRFVPTFTVLATRHANGYPLVPAALSAAAPDLADAIFMTGGEGDWSRVAVLPFRSADIAPELVIKLSRSPASNGRTRHERAVLSDLAEGARSVCDRSFAAPDRSGDGSRSRRSETAGHMRETFPRSLGSLRLGPLDGAIETRVVGRPLHLSARTSSDRRRAIDALHAITEWLIDLARVPCRRADRTAEPIRLLAPALEAYSATFLMTTEEADLIAGTLARAAGLSGSRLPVTWEHHDLGPWNIVLAGREVRVIDWEMARPGFGLADLVYLVLHWNWTVRGIEPEDARIAALLQLLDPIAPRDDLAAAAHDALARYIDALDLDPRLLDLMVIHVLAEQALDRVGRLRDAGDPDAARRDGNRYVGYLEAIAHSRIPAGVPHRPEPLVLS